MGNVCWLPCKAQQLATSSAPFQPDQPLEEKNVCVFGTCAQRLPKTLSMKQHENKQNKKEENGSRDHRDHLRAQVVDVSTVST